MESEKSEHVIRSAVAGATRMPSDGTDDDEVRERGAFPELCFHCGRPNPVVLPTVYQRVAHRVSVCGHRLVAVGSRRCIISK